MAPMLGRIRDDHCPNWRCRHCRHGNDGMTRRSKRAEQAEVRAQWHGWRFPDGCPDWPDCATAEDEDG